MLAFWGLPKRTHLLKMTTDYSTSLSTSSKTRPPRRSWRELSSHSLLTETWPLMRGWLTVLFSFPCQIVHIKSTPNNQHRVALVYHIKLLSACQHKWCLLWILCRESWETCPLITFFKTTVKYQDLFCINLVMCISLVCNTLKLFYHTCWPQSIVMSEKLISPLFSILSKIIRFMCACGLNRSLRRNISLLLSTLKSDSLG